MRSKTHEIKQQEIAPIQDGSDDKLSKKKESSKIDMDQKQRDDAESDNKKKSETEEIRRSAKSSQKTDDGLEKLEKPSRRLSDENKKKRKRSMRVDDKKEMNGTLQHESETDILSSNVKKVSDTVNTTAHVEEKAIYDQIESEKTTISTATDVDTESEAIKTKLNVNVEGTLKPKIADVSGSDETADTLRIGKSQEELSTLTPTPALRSRKKLPTIERPMFESQLTNRSSSTGSSAKLTCSYTGAKVRVQWYKDGLPLQITNNVNINTGQEGITSLRINAITLNDAGQYTCALSNAHGECESNATITVFEPPSEIEPPIKQERRRRSSTTQKQVKSIDQPMKAEFSPKILRKPIIETRLRNRTADLGSSVQLICSFSGCDYQIKWLRNGYDLKADKSKYKISESEGFAYLNILNIEKDDCGEYKCIISNASGHTESTCDIKIYDDGSSQLNEQLKRKAKKDEQNYLKASPIVATNTPITLSHIKGKKNAHQNFLTFLMALQMWNTFLVTKKSSTKNKIKCPCYLIVCISAIIQIVFSNLSLFCDWSEN